MTSLIYILCGITSFVVAYLQWKTYVANRTPFLLWMSIGFFAFFVNNVFLYLDYITDPSFPLFVPRTLSSLVGLCSILYGFIWEAEKE